MNSLRSALAVTALLAVMPARAQSTVATEKQLPLASAMGGGVPLATEGEVVAGVGVSGGTTEQDIDIVETAMK
jgi:uncharacterized protein GlcG (DUF336 family)